MKALLYKQLKLAAHPMTFLFPLLSFLLLVPSYPYTIAFFYTALGIFFMYQNMREQRDADYCALLPIRKGDTVKAAITFSAGVELVSLLIAVPAAILSQRINPIGGNGAGIDANAALLGVGFLLYAVFNLVFFPSFYRSGYKVGLAFLKSCIVMLFVVALDVAGPHIPGFAVLDGDFRAEQIPLLAAGAAVYVLATLIACRISAARYEKVDL